MNTQGTITEKAAKGATMGAVLAGAALGAGAVLLANKENRDKVKELAKKTSNEVKKMTRKSSTDQLIEDVEEQVMGDKHL